MTLDGRHHATGSAPSRWTPPSTREGGVTALFGRSGSGKTSLINIIAGLMQPDHGRIALDGTVLVDTDAKALRARAIAAASATSSRRRGCFRI